MQLPEMPICLVKYCETVCDRFSSRKPKIPGLVVRGIIIIMYLTYLQENFKPVAHRSASVEVFDEEDAQVVHPVPSYWGCQGT